MLITVPTWAIPVLLSVVVVVAGHKWTRAHCESGGTYGGIGNAPVGLVGLAMMLVGVLVVWVLYFAIGWWCA